MTDRRRPDPNQTAAAPVTGFARAADMIARTTAAAKAELAALFVFDSSGLGR